MLNPFLLFLAPVLLFLAVGVVHARWRLKRGRNRKTESWAKKQKPDPDPLWAHLLFEEWKLRQEHFWSSLFRWGGIVVALTIVPYVKPEIARELMGAVLLFPFLAAAMGLFGAWHLASEYARQRTVASMLDIARKNYTPPWRFGDKMWHRPLQMNLGWAAPVALFAGSFYVSAWNLLLLTALYQRSTSQPESRFPHSYLVLSGVGVGLLIYAVLYAFSEHGSPRRTIGDEADVGSSKR